VQVINADWITAIGLTTVIYLRFIQHPINACFHGA
jgi:hypothetical protein